MTEQLTPEKWEELKADYGDNAHLMCEWQYKNNGTNIWTDEWFSCDRPVSFKQSLSYRVKQSSHEIPTKGKP